MALREQYGSTWPEWNCAHRQGSAAKWCVQKLNIYMNLYLMQKWSAKSIQ
jgi:hypothetical protein